MNTASNLLVAGCSVENSVYVTIQQLPKQYDGIKEPDKSDNYTTFRDKKIKWIIEDNNSKKTTENAFDATTPDKEEGKGKRHFISYEGQKYTKEEFLKAMFADYKKYPYKVQFNNDNVFYLNGNQRARLQYHILAQNFELVEVAEQDKLDLKMLCSNHNGETAKRWYNRMSWKQGHEKMITFGAALDVRSYKDNGKTTYSNIKGVWCYHVQMDDNTATYTGTYMTWEDWESRILSCIGIRLWDIERRKEKIQEDGSQCISALYYQQGLYLTLPYEESNELKKWLRNYIKYGNATFPYSGEMPNADLAFTIDFKKDVEIVKQHDNTRHNKEMGKFMVENTFNRLIGDEWTTQEIYKQGFNKGNLDRFVKYGLIERAKRGHYRRVTM